MNIILYISLKNVLVDQKNRLVEMVLFEYP